MLGVGVASSAGGEGREQFSRSWRDGKGFQLLCRSCQCRPQPPELAMDMAPASSPACQPLLALADLPECT